MLQFYINSVSVMLMIQSIHGNTICREIPDKLLTKILGGAYNARYMSVDPPNEIPDADDTKRGLHASFYVPNNYSRELQEVEASSINDAEDEKVEGEKRDERNLQIDIKNRRSEWDCEPSVVWMDLGPDYFPRYLRNIKCGGTICWYGQYRCAPKSFSLKLLKRKRERCVDSAPGSKVGTKGLHQELKDLWVWEERAVNFCCDCVPP